MTLPGYEVNLTESPPSISGIADSGVVFAVGHAGTAVPLAEVFNTDQLAAAIGDHAGAPLLTDFFDEFFHEGGYKGYVSSAIGSADDAAIVALLQNFDSLGGIVGQVTAPGITTATVQKGVMAYALATGRVAILDGSDTPTAATLEAQSAALIGQPGDRFSALFAPWDVIPGLTTDTTRTAPPSGRICGNIARNDSAGLSANDPAAGPNGIAGWASDLSQKFSDSDAATLNGASVNLSRMVRNNPRTMGWRSLADQATDANWSMFSGSRLVMIIRYNLGLVAENFEFSKIDSRDHTIKKYAGAIQGALLPFWESDDLYGDSPDEAFAVDVGPAVNTAETIAAGELHAKVALRTSPFGERVIIDVAKVPITQALA